MKNKVFTLLNCGLLLLSTTFLYAQKCEVKITSPANGSQTDLDVLVSGTATLPPKDHLWVLAHKVGFSGWWPQGNGQAQIIGNEWDVLVFCGTKGDMGIFEIAALVVSEQTHLDLEKWVREAPPTYPPIPFPTGVDGCPIVKIRVDKTKD